MADIKNIITGTINSIVDKAKEVAENANVKETVKDIYEQGSSKVRSYSAIAKLSLELTGDKSELNKLYTEIGRLYFEETAEPDDFFAPLFEQAREIYERIAEKEALIGLLKDEDCDGEEAEHCSDAEIEVEVCEFEEVVEATEAEACCCEGEECCCEAEPCAEETPAEETQE